MTLLPYEMDAVNKARRALGHPDVPYPAHAGDVAPYRVLREAFAEQGIADVPYINPSVSGITLITDRGRYASFVPSLPRGVLAWLRSNPVPGWDIRVRRRGADWYISALPLPTPAAAAR